jgi:hypothetical protein
LLGRTSYLPVFEEDFLNSWDSNDGFVGRFFQIGTLSINEFVEDPLVTSMKTQTTAAKYYGRYLSRTGVSGSNLSVPKNNGILKRSLTFSA